MKRLLPLLLLSVTMMFTACDDVYYPEQLQGRWASITNAKESALILDFEGETVTVSNGSRNYKPFTSDVTWDYYMTRDSVLYISRYTYYDGDSYDSESYVLDLSFKDSYNTLILTYDPLIGSTRRYTFMRRN